MTHRVRKARGQSGAGRGEAGLQPRTARRFPQRLEPRQHCSLHTHARAHTHTHTHTLTHTHITGSYTKTLNLHFKFKLLWRGGL